MSKIRGGGGLVICDEGGHFNVTTFLCRLDMKLKNFAALCFDMDFTLANYNLENFSPMIYDMMAKYLVTKKGYAKELNLLTASDVSTIT